VFLDYVLRDFFLMKKIFDEIFDFGLF